MKPTWQGKLVISNFSKSKVGKYAITKLLLPFPPLTPKRGNSRRHCVIGNVSTRDLAMLI